MNIKSLFAAVTPIIPVSAEKETEETTPANVAPVKEQLATFDEPDETPIVSEPVNPVETVEQAEAVEQAEMVEQTEVVEPVEKEETKQPAMETEKQPAATNEDVPAKTEEKQERRPRYRGRKEDTTVGKRRGSER